jgi:hypothetical protein
LALFTIVVCFIAICVGTTAHAHQVNLSTARVELLPDRTVSVVVGLKGSDADRLAGTQIYDGRKDLADPDLVSSFMNIRVADIQACYELWRSRGAEFITEPKPKYGETRCYIRDPDGYIIEVGQSNPGVAYG